MKEMEKAKNKATAWIVFSALYATVAAILEEGGFFWAEAFVPLICMICAAACFELGRDYQFEVERNFDEMEMKLKKEEFEWQIVEVKECAECSCAAVGRAVYNSVYT